VGVVGVVGLLQPVGVLVEPWGPPWVEVVVGVGVLQRRELPLQQ